MLISEFAIATGLSRDTIRFYVRKALLHPDVGSTDNNRYMTFDDTDVERALLIRTAQSLGFTLREISALDSEFDGDVPAERQIELMRERVEAIDSQVASLRSVRSYLAKKIAWLESGSLGAAPKLRIRA